MSAVESSRRPMNRLSLVRAALPLLLLAANGCSVDTTPAPEVPFAKLDMLIDFERNLNLSADPRWDGAFAASFDGSPNAVMTANAEELVPPRMNPDGTASPTALHAKADGNHTMWGTAWFAPLKNSTAVDLSDYTGISLWARSDGWPIQTIKFALADYASYPNPSDITPICDMNDNTVGGKGCYDDYSVKIYPDGEWRRYDIPFSQLTTGGWGLNHAFDPSRLYAIKFAMLPSIQYSEWIDDIALYRRE